MANMAVKEREEVARPLRVLEPLIQKNLSLIAEAKRQAGMQYFRDTGDLLLEARPQFSSYADFVAWARRKFDIGKDIASQYMKLAEASADNSSALESPSLSDFIRKTTNPNYNRPAQWHEDVKKVVDRVDTQTLNLKREELKRGDEREAQRELGLQLIDIGYKVLARTLHPDKGGSRDAMARLNAERDRLKQNA